MMYESWKKHKFLKIQDPQESIVYNVYAAHIRSTPVAVLIPRNHTAVCYRAIFIG